MTWRCLTELLSRAHMLLWMAKPGSVVSFAQDSTPYIPRQEKAVLSFSNATLEYAAY